MSWAVAASWQAGGFVVPSPPLKEGLLGLHAMSPAATRTGAVVTADSTVDAMGRAAAAATATTSAPTTVRSEDDLGHRRPLRRRLCNPCDHTAALLPERDGCGRHPVHSGADATPGSPLPPPDGPPALSLDRLLLSTVGAGGCYVAPMLRS